MYFTILFVDIFKKISVKAIITESRAGRLFFLEIRVGMYFKKKLNFAKT